jgi:hypothetical protein
MNTEMKKNNSRQKGSWYGSAKERLNTWQRVKNTLTHTVANKLRKDVQESRDEW